MFRNLLFYYTIKYSTGLPGFQVDSPTKSTYASEIPRQAPPYTDRAREEPWEGERRPRRTLVIDLLPLPLRGSPHC